MLDAIESVIKTLERRSKEIDSEKKSEYPDIVFLMDLMQIVIKELYKRL